MPATALNIPKTDPRTQRIIRLLAELAMESPPFMQPFERGPWLEKQVDVFLTLYRQYQGNSRVRSFLAEVDGGSRTDHSVEEAVWRARKIARAYLDAVLRDIEEANTCPSPEKTNNSSFNAWAEGRQVINNADGNEWHRQAQREANKQIKLEISPAGYVREKAKH